MCQYQRMQAYPHGEVVIVVDCEDLDRAADFWTEVLGYSRDGEPSERYLSLLPASEHGPDVLLQKVPERKSGKNRLHLDLRTRDLGREVERAVGLGAVRLSTEPLLEGGWLWHVLADPDGNEFCVLQPPATYWT
jgi:predicted enzyme related to lactoylglutathione lyase